jgi:hypothetical protein
VTSTSSAIAVHAARASSSHSAFADAMSMSPTTSLAPARDDYDLAGESFELH